MNALHGRDSVIRLRGVAVHNLQRIDVDVPQGKLTVICGVSGSGKTSLALDTLFAEGQRRYIESFSAYSRQFLARLARPVADEISGIPPAVLVTQRDALATSQRSLGATTEITDYLRLLFTQLGTIHCPECQRPIQRQSPASMARRCDALPPGTRYLVGFVADTSSWTTRDELAEWLLSQGFLRVLDADGHLWTLSDQAARDRWRTAGDDEPLTVIVDRLIAGSGSPDRVREAWEVAVNHGEGRAEWLIHPGAASLDDIPTDWHPREATLSGDRWWHVRCESGRRCPQCELELPRPQPRLFNPHSPLGACPVCHGTGERAPDGPAAKKPVTSAGVARNADADCPQCHGSGLRAEALAVRVADRSIDAWCRESLTDLLTLLRTLAASRGQFPGPVLEQLSRRLEYLTSVGLGHLSLHRPVCTLSHGERQRVALTTALGSNLVNLLYVLDEPTAGLHPADVERILDAMRQLRDRGNTIVVVEHDERIIRAADHVIEIGPGAGEGGGHVTFVGSPHELEHDHDTLTGAFLAQRRGQSLIQRRPTRRGSIRLLKASGHNLQTIDVTFPLGVLTVVTGVSGSGKTALVDGTLYPALCKRKRKKVPPFLSYDEIVGDGQFDDVILIDPSPLGRSRRSNPVTLMKAFDEIRSVFADCMIARMRNLSPSHFSFNVDGGGRCETCQGDGSLTIDMHFLPDVEVLCPDCQGSRYRSDILDIRYRGQNIADVLSMTVRQAYAFFRGRVKLQSRLHKLIEVGLDYLRLGQRANTLSAGEVQRLKLAYYLGTSKRSRTVFLMDEPTRGLHFQDIVQLMDCFDALLSIGHSLIIVEQNLQLLRAADHIIELGPGAGDAGGRVVVCGTPEEVAAAEESPTSRFLRGVL